MAGENVIGAAPTGSGKTAAFALPILQRLSADPYGIFALVLTPTRSVRAYIVYVCARSIVRSLFRFALSCTTDSELAIQIKDQFVALGKPIGVRCAVIVGGEQATGQALRLSQHPHIVISTPGRLVEHLSTNRNDLFLKRLQFLVLDEADRLLAPGFNDELSRILRELPPSEARQTLYFSATMTATLDRVVQVSKKTPFRFDHSPE